MLVAFLVCGVGLAAVLAAVYLDEPVEFAGPQEPAWDSLPSPWEVARAEFPASYPGYDPASVDVHLDAVARVYADLLAVAPAEVRERAARRVAERTGREPPVTIGWKAPVATALADVAEDAAEDDEHDDEALRAEAALAHLQSLDRDPTPPAPHDPGGSPIPPGRSGGSESPTSPA
jgi:DivIVA domain-containing protein